MATKPWQFQPEGERSLGRKSLQLKLDVQMLQQIYAIPGWQKKLRDALPDLIEKWKAEAEESLSKNSSDR